MPTHHITVALALLVGFLAPGTAVAQDQPRDTEPADLRTRLIQRFDTDGNGRLDATEREVARKFVQSLRERHTDIEPLPQTLNPADSDLYKVAPGEHAFDTIRTYDLADTERDKVIPLRITIPRGDGPFPLVIYCHGAMGSKDNGDPLVHHWASHGYIVIQPTFGDSASLMTPAEKARYRSLLELVNSPRVLEQWDDRPRDVKHVLDQLDTLQKAVKPLENKLDRERIAVAGHSFGAHTTMLLAGLRLTHPRKGQSPDFADKRIKAFIAISPQGPGQSLTEDAYKDLAEPMLMITGDHDGSPIRGQEEQTGAWRRKAFDHSLPGDRLLLWIKNAHHGFGGITGKAGFPGAGPVAPDQVLIIQSTTTAFLDAFVKRNDEARKYLNTDTLTRETKGNATVTQRKETPGPPGNP